MRPSLKSLFVIILLIAPVALSAEGPPKGAPFRPGETVTYNIKKMALKAGKTVIVFNGPAQWKGKQVLRITFTASALNFFDEEKIYFSPEDFYPVAVERNLNLWGKKEKIIEEYDQVQNRVVITKEAGGETTRQVINKDSRLDNLYCFIYRYRMEGNFKVGDEFNVHLPTQDVRFKAVRKEEMNVAGDQYSALYLESVPSKYRIWFDDSPKRVPLRIDGAVGFGNTAMVMQEYKR